MRVLGSTADRRINLFFASVFLFSILPKMPWRRITKKSTLCFLSFFLQNATCYTCWVQVIENQNRIYLSSPYTSYIWHISASSSVQNILYTIFFPVYFNGLPTHLSDCGPKLITLDLQTVSVSRMNSGLPLGLRFPANLLLP